jgi:hypothetical protein
MKSVRKIFIILNYHKFDYIKLNSCIFSSFFYPALLQLFSCLKYPEPLYFMILSLDSLLKVIFHVFHRKPRIYFKRSTFKKILLVCLSSFSYKTDKLYNSRQKENSFVQLIHCFFRKNIFNNKFYLLIESFKIDLKELTIVIGLIDFPYHFMVKNSKIAKNTHQNCKIFKKEEFFLI